MGAHKLGDGRKAGARGKADCRADTRGGSWAGIPKCLIDSPAYRDLSLHARAVLVELVARMNGYNNGQIGASQRELKDALGCTPRYVVAALAELMGHGMIDVVAEGQWKQRQARLYRLTFVSTKGAAATNDYLQWTPAPEQSRVSHGEAGKHQSAFHREARRQHPASYGEAAKVTRLREAALVPASHGEPLICKPYPSAPDRQRRGDTGSSAKPPETGGVRYDRGMAGDQRTCEQCGEAFTLRRADRAHPQRYCSEGCRHKAERARAYRRCKGEPVLSPAKAVHLTLVPRVDPFSTCGSPTLTGGACKRTDVCENGRCSIHGGLGGTFPVKRTAP